MILPLQDATDGCTSVCVCGGGGGGGGQVLPSVVRSKCPLKAVKNEITYIMKNRT